MKTRKNYKMPLFFGWYTIGSHTPEGENNRLKSGQFSTGDLNSYRR